jgi:hypothetical protein
LSYAAWINGIKKGRTVVTTNGHLEFLDLRVNESFTPGDEIYLKGSKKVAVTATWTSVPDQEGAIEIVCNGRIVARLDTSALPLKPVTLSFELPVNQSSWICARRMNSDGHQSHTAPVYVTVDNKPVRASAEDAEYFATWIENILENINDGGSWRSYFSKDIAKVHTRYRKAAGLYKNIARECQAERSRSQTKNL